MYLDFIRYWLKAGDAHTIHSPFVFEFYTQVFKSSIQNDYFEKIENQRGKLLQRTESIDIKDFGAGSRVEKNTKRKISSIARTSLKTKKWALILNRIARFYKYQNIIELGTSFGITTSYLATSTPQCNVFTFEGSPEIGKIAQNTFQNLELSNIELITGNIDETLPHFLSNYGCIDFIFFDANHTYEATIRYFETALKSIHNDTCFVFDDIYWSEGMKSAWEEIINHDSVTVSIDLFFVGIVFFRRESPKQHFIIK
ncbi:MAG: class I SAM-dependent methyltransferase [Cytophagaceae bacterium]|nr:class I SAM-dependent methyltransferase [Cytophagaceae bacterium]